LVINKVKQFRVVRDITQEQLASAVNITWQSLNAIEKNKYNPSLELALELCEFFDCKVEDLFQLDNWGGKIMKRFFGENVLASIFLMLTIATLTSFEDFGGWSFNNIKKGALNFLIVCAVYIAFSFLIEAFKNKKKPEQYPLPEMDERTKKNRVKFLAQIFGLSHMIAAVILIFLNICNHNTIPVEYALYYVVGVLFFTMTIGVKIVSKL